jgi:class 3 adenylate cyclase
METPDTQYADSDGVSIAFQVVGDGPLDLLVAPGFISHLDMFWSFPSAAAAIERLTSFARLILFDKRGTGLSDPSTTAASLDERIADMRAVLDAAGSQKAALLGMSEGGPMSVLFAATYPERTIALALYGSLVWGGDPDLVEHWGEIAALADNWGHGESGRIFSPSVNDNLVLRRMLGVFERACASPAMVRLLLDGIRLVDVRSVLHAVRVPTVVIHREHERAVPLSQARALAEGIPGAQLVVLPGIDHNPFVGDYGAVTDAITHFLTGRVARPAHERVLTTLLFTDIVGSTETAASMQDAAWRTVLEAHNRVVRETLTEFRGREVNTTGDGFVATFDGPARAIACAAAIRDAVEALGLQVRAGLHTGEVEVIGDDVAGVAVHLAARVCGIAGAGEVLVTSTVKDLVVGAGLEFGDRGSHELKGVPGAWTLFEVGMSGSLEHTMQLAPADSVGHLSRFDRAAVRVASRSPSTARFLARVAGAPR